MDIYTKWRGESKTSYKIWQDQPKGATIFWSLKKLSNFIKNFTSIKVYRIS